MPLSLRSTPGEPRRVMHSTDLDVKPKEIIELASPDALTAFLARLARQFVEAGIDLKLDHRDKVYASLHGDKEKRLVGEIEALARRPDLRFFHWDIEFPEVFFGFIDADRRQIKHKDRIDEGSAGFDCVVGNPPYDVLAEKELGTDLGELLGYHSAPYWRSSTASWLTGISVWAARMPASATASCTTCLARPSSPANPTTSQSEALSRRLGAALGTRRLASSSRTL